MNASQYASAAIVPVREGALHRALLDNGGKSGRNSNQDIELRPHRVLLANGGDSTSIPRPYNELQRHRVLLDNATTRRLPPPLRLSQTLPLPHRRVPLAASTLGIGVGLAPAAVLHAAPPEVPGMARQPGRLGCRLALLAARVRTARHLPWPQSRIRNEPLSAEPARPLPPT